jgi:predicted dehydrogenase
MPVASSHSKVGILGTGFVADSFHMRCFKQLGVEVVAAGTRREEAGRNFTRRWGISRLYHGEDAIKQLCADPEVDFVDIALPNYLHEKAALAAAESGKAVACEKPLGRSVEEAQRMVDTVRKHSVPNFYAENQVFAPQIETVRQIVKQGGIGKVFWVRSREAHFGPHSRWFWDPGLSGGGVLMDMGCHSIEVAHRLINARPIEVFAWDGTLVHDTKAEDNSLILVRYADGQIGQSENSWAAHGGLDLRFEIYGSEGSAFVDVTRETGTRVFTVAPEEKVGYIVEKAEAKKGWLHPISLEHEMYGYLSEFKHFFDCVKTDRKPMESFEDGLLVNRIISAGYKSANTRQWTALG